MNYQGLRATGTFSVLCDLLCLILAHFGEYCADPELLELSGS